MNNNILSDFSKILFFKIKVCCIFLSSKNEMKQQQTKIKNLGRFQAIRKFA